MRWRGARRDLLVDLTCLSLAFFTAFVLGADAVDAGRQGPDGYVLACALLTLAGCVALWQRRARPMAVALFEVALAGFTEYVAGAMLIAAFGVAVHRPWRQVALVMGVGCVAAVPYALVRPDPDLAEAGFGPLGQAVAGVALSFLLMTPPVAWGMVVRARRELIDSLRERAERAEAEALLRAEQIRGREREDIAREMHDVLAHRITLMSLHAGALELRRDMGAEEVAKVAGTIRTSAHQALEDLREILGVLRAGPGGEGREGGRAGAGPRPQPGVADIAELVSESRAAGLPVLLEDRLPAGEGVPPSVGRTAYRVVQEGLTNARKHAPGREVLVGLARAGKDELHIRVRNALGARAGESRLPGSRSGLLGLTERVSLAGGRIDYGPRRAEDGGVDFCLEAWLPWPKT
ncbi:sensor histidine kinase [Streptomyces hoynatensis]|uniref:histidine kinase n=1 Tax=Streptomyces hoynatensis TaxID=1141874 RepID=A0A3A9YPJ1_9ACTN|nr:histidine kinase [Streptomyces hoynatensis]RKN37912.1 sensor histidine kinase [Streptomyces hoynatensis]